MFTRFESTIPKIFFFAEDSNRKLKLQFISLVFRDSVPRNFDRLSQNLTYNVTVRRVRATIFAMQRQEVLQGETAALWQIKWSLYWITVILYFNVSPVTCHSYT
jgi:hypothetical protein